MVNIQDLDTLLQCHGSLEIKEIVIIAQLGEHFLLAGFLDIEPKELMTFLRRLSFISVLHYLIKWYICFHLNMFIESLLGVSWTG